MKNGTKAKLVSKNPADGDDEALYVKSYKESGIRYGIRNLIDDVSTSTSTSSTRGIYSSVYTYPNTNSYNYGFYNKIFTQGTTRSYGIYNSNQIQSTFSGNSNIYGILSEIDGGDNHTGNTYGLVLLNDGTTTGTEYGVFTSGEDANYFSGKVQIGGAAYAPKNQLDIYNSSGQSLMLVRDDASTNDNDQLGGKTF